jgi:hypothetical protein
MSSGIRIEDTVASDSLGVLTNLVSNPRVAFLLFGGGKDICAVKMSIQDVAIIKG